MHHPPFRAPRDAIILASRANAGKANPPMELTALIHALEMRLLQPEVRASGEALGELLAPDFVEFGSSGRAYDLPQILAALHDERSAPVPERTISDFAVRLLAERRGTRDLPRCATRAGRGGPGVLPAQLGLLRGCDHKFPLRGASARLRVLPPCDEFLRVLAKFWARTCQGRMDNLGRLLAGDARPLVEGQSATDRCCAARSELRRKHSGSAASGTRRANAVGRECHFARQEPDCEIADRALGHGALRSSCIAARICAGRRRGPSCRTRRSRVRAARPAPRRTRAPRLQKPHFQRVDECGSSIAGSPFLRSRAMRG